MSKKIRRERSKDGRSGGPKGFNPAKRGGGQGVRAGGFMAEVIAPDSAMEQAIAGAVRVVDSGAIPVQPDGIPEGNVAFLPLFQVEPDKGDVAAFVSQAQDAINRLPVAERLRLGGAVVFHNWYLRTGTEGESPYKAGVILELQISPKLSHAERLPNDGALLLLFPLPETVSALTLAQHAPVMILTTQPLDSPLETVSGVSIRLYGELRNIMSQYAALAASRDLRSRSRMIEASVEPESGLDSEG